MPDLPSDSLIKHLLQEWPLYLSSPSVRETLVYKAFANHLDWIGLIKADDTANGWVARNVIGLLSHPRSDDGAHPLVLLLEQQRDDLKAEEPWNSYITEVARRVGVRVALTAQRRAELAYLKSLRERGEDDKYRLGRAEDYVPLGGNAMQQSGEAPPPFRAKRRKPALVATGVGVGPSFRLRTESKEASEGNGEARVRVEHSAPFDDVATEILKQGWVVVLGEPGAGKSTALVALASRMATKAETDELAPIPLLINLAEWREPDTKIHDEIARQTGPLATYLPALMAHGRAGLLLDSLNEIPTSQWAQKHAALRDYLAQYRAGQPQALAAVTSRDADYVHDLGLRKIDIEPLDKLRIQQFCHAYVEPETSADALFDQIRRSDSLLQLARNPFFLNVLIDQYVDSPDDTLPELRGRLLEAFVENLVHRELKSERFIDGREAVTLLDQLSALAFELQRAASADGKRAAGTVIDLERAKAVLSDAQLAQARACTLLQVGDTVRFSHQLLQEYFAARRMQAEIEGGRLKAEEIWPRERWWQPTGWEVATRMLAELHTDGPEAVMVWLADAQPDLASECVTQDTVQLPEDSVLLAMRAKWQPRLLDIKGEPEPESRAGVGRALGRIRLRSGALLDERRGIGVKDGVPEIEWVRVPAGKFVYGGDEGAWFSGNGLEEWLYRWRNRRRTMQLPAFEIARYPVTYAQFEAFVRAEDGFANARWWEGLGASEQDHSAPGEQYFRFWNHPRERVSWYDAVAFCRWLSAKLGCEVRLPDEREWERAARHTDGREYPWGMEYVSGHANIDERPTGIGKHNLQSTSAVGIYPQGAAKVTDAGEIDDLSGNVWEWCLNEYARPSRFGMGGSSVRVLRGGSWSVSHDLARASIPSRFYPDNRSYLRGFRVCRPC